MKDITSALTAAVTTKPSAKSSGAPGARKGKRKGKKETLDSLGATDQRRQSTIATDKPPNWGVFEPLRGPLEPITSILSPFFTSQVIIAVLATLLLYTWLSGPSRSSHTPNSVGFSGSPARTAAYEELWRREESELWDWLEDRVGMASGAGVYAPEVKERQKVLSAREMGRRLQGESMRGREVDDAIRVTEERLRALKGAVERGRGGGES